MENTRGSLFMVLAMAAFAIEDMFLKAAATHMPVGIALALFGLGGSAVFIALTKRHDEQIIHPELFTKPIMLRAAAEITGRLFFTLAITLTPLSSASAILQATPLVVVLGAALLFGEQVGWRRWMAILIGFVGVLMIIRPGVDSFNPASILAVISVLGFAGRDLATRAAPPVFSNRQLGVYGFLVLIPTGLALHLYSGEGFYTSGMGLMQITGTVIFGVIAYNALTVAMRTGDVSVVTPFRYTRLLFALVLAVLVFDETPDLITLAGGAIVVISGVYTLLCSRSKSRAASTKVLSNAR